MRISELARESGTPLATVKFYLREGLLQPGERTSATQAIYDDRHLRRLRLIRVLVDFAGLSLAQVKVVITALSEDNVLAAAALAHRNLAPQVEESVETDRATAALQRHGWFVDPTSPSVRQLAAVLHAAESLGLPMPPELFDVYAEAAHQVATAEVSGIVTGNVEQAVNEVVIGTVLFEPVWGALRRCAQADVSRRLWEELEDG